MAIQSTSPTAFLSKTYEEALGLIIEARDYLATEEPADRTRMAIADRFQLTCETFRLTSRLTHIMAWLLARKAVLAGELTAVEASRAPYLLGRDEVLTHSDPKTYKNFPEHLTQLMDRSYRLYIRVSRLDELAQRTAHQGPLWGQ